MPQYDKGFRSIVLSLLHRLVVVSYII